VVKCIGEIDALSGIHGPQDRWHGLCSLSSNMRKLKCVGGSPGRDVNGGGPEASPAGPGPAGAASQVCSEEAFHALLEIEQRRAERSGRPIVVLLVDLRDRASRPIRLDRPDTARQLFAAMVGCLRETDVIGWYRQGRVAGAVLTELGQVVEWEAVRTIGNAVGARLTESLPRALAGGLRVRVQRYPETGDAEWRVHSALLPVSGPPGSTRRFVLAMRGWIAGAVGVTSHTSGEAGC
jgi:hypothetical protein